MADPDVQGLENSVNHLDAEARAARAQVNNQLRGQDLTNNTPEQYAGRVHNALGTYRDENQGVLNEVPPMRERLQRINERLQRYQHENTWGYKIAKHWRGLVLGGVCAALTILGSCLMYSGYSQPVATGKNPPEKTLENKVKTAMPSTSDTDESPLPYYSDAMNAMKERANVYKEQEKMARDMYKHKLEAAKAKVAAEQRQLMGYK